MTDWKDGFGLRRSRLLENVMTSRPRKFLVTGREARTCLLILGGRVLILSNVFQNWHLFIASRSM